MGEAMLGGGTDMVPYLTVYKEGAAIDRICLQGKDAWVVGRHADCDIWVGHSSTSRHHLEIQVLHATMEFLLTDLQSVHGTRVNGELVGGLDPRLAKQNDMIQLGASTRIYKIDWLPLRAAEQYSDDSGAISVESTHSNADKLELSSQGGSKTSFRYKIESQEGRRIPGQQVMRENTENSGSIGLDENTSRSNIRQHTRGQNSGITGQDENKECRSTFRQQTKRENSFGSVVQDENAPSPAKSQGQRGANELPPRVPARRQAFAALQPSALNVRSPRSPVVRKSPAPEKLTPTKFSPAPDKLTPTKQVNMVGPDGLTPSKLWLRRCTSAPLPSLVTAPGGISNTSKAELNTPQETQPGEVLATLTEDNSVSELGSIESALRKLSVRYDSEEEHYPSDKENLPPDENYLPRLGSVKKSLWCGGGESDCGATSSRGSAEGHREPFQPLFMTTESMGYKPVFTPSYVSSPDEDFGSRALGLPRPQRRGSSSGAHLDHMLGRIKLGSGESRRQWHLVVDTNCLLDADALKSLKQLEGIRETRLIIPKIVVRELDCLKRRDNMKVGARFALKWIEECMIRMPFWIHVQSSSETLPVRITPPSSPSYHSRVFSQYGDAGDLMSPTNDDHVLECALLFDRTVLDGRVALLTRDTALKIKAMAEGLIVDSAPQFSESLLSPYSDRFLWTGSTACGPTATRMECSSQHNSHGINSPHLRSSADLRSSKSLLSALAAAATPKALGKHGGEEFRSHYSEQPRGLQLVLK